MKPVFPLFLLLALLTACGGSSGPGPAPSATLSDISLMFGTEDVATASQPLTLTITNSGNADLVVAGVRPSGQFQETDSCVGTVKPAANCTITVSFTPSASGAASGMLTITDNAKDSPQTISLSGTGTSTGGACSVRSQECGSTPPLHPCCSGLTCSPASTRAFCVPN
jgi:hypothetical protein